MELLAEPGSELGPSMSPAVSMAEMHGAVAGGKWPW